MDRLCRVCNEPIEYYRTEDVCFECDYWTEIIRLKNRRNVVIANGRCYNIGSEKSQSEFRGFDGYQFTIRFLNRWFRPAVKTTNLWANGEIPGRFRARLPDNAEFIGEAPVA